MYIFLTIINSGRWETRFLSSLRITYNLPLISLLIITKKKVWERDGSRQTFQIWTWVLIGCYNCIDTQYNALFMSHWRNWLQRIIKEQVSYWLFFFTTVILARNSSMLPPPYSLSNSFFVVVWVEFFFCE